MGLFGKKDKSGDDDSSRLVLFGSRSKAKSPAAASNNPYAQAALPDPYTQAKMNAGIIPSTQSPSQQGGYGRSNQQPPNEKPSGYGPSRYGNESGYGSSNPYGQQRDQNGGQQRPGGGYGGLRRADSGDTQATDAKRDQLFGGARERVGQYQQQPQPQQGDPPAYQYNPAPGPVENRSYGAYGDRQLTAEEEEEQEIQAVKQDIRFMKQSDIASLQNIGRMGQQSIETGTNTLAMLATQGERLHNTRQHLEIAERRMDVAHDRTKELEKLNNRPFFIPVEGPFNANRRKLQKEEVSFERHKAEREQMAESRAAGYEHGQRMNQTFRSIGEAGRPGGQKTSLADRSKFQFEADSEDEEMENQIEAGLDNAHAVARQMNAIARGLGDEIERQNKDIDAIAALSDRVDDKVHVGSHRLNRIR